MKSGVLHDRNPKLNTQHAVCSNLSTFCGEIKEILKGKIVVFMGDVQTVDIDSALHVDVLFRTKKLQRHTLFYTRSNCFGFQDRWYNLNVKT